MPSAMYLLATHQRSPILKSFLPSRVRTDQLLCHREPADAEALSTAISESLERLRTLAGLGSGRASAEREASQVNRWLSPGVEFAEIRHDEANLSSGRVPEELGFARREVSYREPSAPSDSEFEVDWVLSRQAWLKLGR
jgi:hypothetical protein